MADDPSDQAGSTPPTGEGEPARMKPCPICGKLAIPQYRPFCSKRCKQVDLNRWFTGHYAIPVVETDDPDEV